MGWIPDVRVRLEFSEDAAGDTPCGDGTEAATDRESAWSALGHYHALRLRRGKLDSWSRIAAGTDDTPSLRGWLFRSQVGLGMASFRASIERRFLHCLGVDAEITDAISAFDPENAPVGGTPVMAVVQLGFSHALETLPLHPHLGTLVTKLREEHLAAPPKSAGRPAEWSPPQSVFLYNLDAADLVVLLVSPCTSELFRGVWRLRRLRIRLGNQKAVYAFRGSHTTLAYGDREQFRSLQPKAKDGATPDDQLQTLMRFQAAPSADEQHFLDRCKEILGRKEGDGQEAGQLLACLGYHDYVFRPSPQSERGMAGAMRLWDEVSRKKGNLQVSTNLHYPAVPLDILDRPPVVPLAIGPSAGSLREIETGLEHGIAAAFRSFFREGHDACEEPLGNECGGSEDADCSGCPESDGNACQAWHRFVAHRADTDADLARLDLNFVQHLYSLLDRFEPYLGPRAIEPQPSAERSFELLPGSHSLKQTLAGVVLHLAQMIQDHFIHCDAQRKHHVNGARELSPIPPPWEKEVEFYLRFLHSLEQELLGRIASAIPSHSRTATAQYYGHLKTQVCTETAARLFTHLLRYSSPVRDIQLYMVLRQNRQRSSQFEKLVRYISPHDGSRRIFLLVTLNPDSIHDFGNSVCMSSHEIAQVVLTELMDVPGMVSQIFEQLAVHGICRLLHGPRVRQHLADGAVADGLSWEDVVRSEAWWASRELLSGIRTFQAAVTLVARSLGVEAIGDSQTWREILEFVDYDSEEAEKTEALEKLVPYLKEALASRYGTDDGLLEARHVFVALPGIRDFCAVELRSPHNPVDVVALFRSLRHYAFRPLPSEDPENPGRRTRELLMGFPTFASYEEALFAWLDTPRYTEISATFGQGGAVHQFYSELSMHLCERGRPYQDVGQFILTMPQETVAEDFTYFISEGVVETFSLGLALALPKLAARSTDPSADPFRYVRQIARVVMDIHLTNPNEATVTQTLKHLIRGMVVSQAYVHCCTPPGEERRDGAYVRDRVLTQFREEAARYDSVVVQEENLFVDRSLQVLRGLLNHEGITADLAGPERQTVVRQLERLLSLFLKKQEETVEEGAVEAARCGSVNVLLNIDQLGRLAELINATYGTYLENRVHSPDGGGELGRVMGLALRLWSLRHPYLAEDKVTPVFGWSRGGRPIRRSRSCPSRGRRSRCH